MIVGCMIHLRSKYTVYREDIEYTRARQNTTSLLVSVTFRVIFLRLHQPTPAPARPNAALPLEEYIPAREHVGRTHRQPDPLL